MFQNKDGIMVAIHQYRVLRMAMILMIIALTIFLYAFYYTNPAMTSPSHSSSSVALQSTAYIGISDAGEIPASSSALSNKSNSSNLLLPGKCVFFYIEFITEC